MKTILSTAIVALALAGCGSSSTGKAGSATASPPAATTTTSTGANYHDMSTLGQSVTDTYNQKYRKGGAMATTASCISTSADAAECNISFADGQSSSVAVTISADGQSWITHAG